MNCGRRNDPAGYREILKICLPLVAGMASSTVMQFTDRLFLSRYSVDAVAASMPAAVASMTIVMTLMGVCGYTTVLIAQYTGSGAPERVGSALWQGIWCALCGSCLLCLAWPLAGPLFDAAGHDPAIRKLEVAYFRILTIGAGFSLAGSSLAGFFSGQGRTRPVMAAGIIAAAVNIPLDYLLIFGGMGIPALGVTGAALATVFGWIVGAVVLAALIFTRENDALFHVRRKIGFEWDMMCRLLRYGLPSGANFFMELAAPAWFSFEVGAFGREALAASNIAFSLNSLIFLPMLGLNIGLSSIVGQAMGRGNPREAERATANTLRLAVAYMLPLALLIAAAAGPLTDLFAPGDISPEEFAPVREFGIFFLYCIAAYSVVDAGNIVYFGALKGAGDTLGVMCLLACGLILLFGLPVMLLKYLGAASAVNYWLVFTAYVMLLAAAAIIRFYRRGWHGIRVVETAPDAKRKEE
ncbi:MAG: MATE family efflux transporter [Desulfovibrio sp.]|jgi:MATE family multidrug resistance protein|nr:MATE family efflux transporter [Desulfovibrio sp.]